MKAIIERILSTGGSLFEERGGRVLAKGTDVDLAEVWELVNPAPQWLPSRADALQHFMYSRGVDRILAEALANYVLKHPVTVEDYYLHVEAVVELTRRQIEGLPDSTKPHWSLDQSLQEARDHINILHKEIDDLKQQVANLQATAVTHLGQMWTTREVLSHLLRGLILEESKIEKFLRQIDDAFASAYSNADEVIGHITGGVIRPHQPPSPELVKILSWTMAEVAAFQESA